jgi:hypothetical protein
VRFELAQDGIGMPAAAALEVEIVDAQQPSAAGAARLQPAGQGGKQRAQVQRPGRSRRKAAAVAAGVQVAASFWKRGS